ncbi:hypothetical protein ABG79_02151 [Caloramator mitchellensis]|uniref:Uncharacterized protein n=1 Tax=Caloramator mitchellensis TaxID=908809 RepID=A0A0R3JRB6_CALMK|nr:hypothetical protein [Caloramator mitchellensis]KRQ86019.1 hypothetical protein ABG79_02151 [Caloramator mitchellensis]
MEVLLISIIDSKDNNKTIEVIGKEEMSEESYLKPMVNILKKNIEAEGGAK